MLVGTFALMERSLRIDARSRSTHLIRVGLIGSIYFSLCTSLLIGGRFGAPGLQLFSSIAQLDAIFLTLLGIGFFSSVITEEKEEDTLGLILMAGVSPLGILAGKSVGGLCQAMLLIAVQYPLGLLAVTMGGVTRGQIWAVTVALLAYTVFLAGLGLLCSTVSPRSKTAAWRTGTCVILAIVLPAIAKSLVRNHTQWVVMGGGAANGPETLSLPQFAWTILETFGRTNIFLELDAMLSTGADESAFTVQVFSNLAMGVVAVGLAWLFFGISTRSPATDTMTRGLVSRRSGILRFGAGRAWANPFLWKDYHFVAGGNAMTLVRTAYFVVLGLIPWMAAKFYFQNVGYAECLYFSIWLMILSATVSAARLLARSMHDEIRGQTLPSLLMLPSSTPRIVYSKYSGVLLGWLPGPLIGPLMFFTDEWFREGCWELLNAPPPSFDSASVILFLLASLSIVLFIALTPHFAAYLALYMRWGAVPLAFGLTYCVMIVIIAAGALLPMITWGVIEPAVAMAIICVFLFALCAACHVGILLRVRALAAK